MNQHSFEDLIRQTLEGYEAEFNPSHWQEMESRLNVLSQGVAVSMNSFYSAFVVAGLFMAGLVYFGMPSDDRRGLAETDEPVEELQISQGLVSGDTTVMTDNEPETPGSMDTFVMDVPSHKMDSFEDTHRTETKSMADELTDETTEKQQNNSKRSVVEYGEMKVKKIKSSVSQGCEGNPITFSTSGSESEGNFLWNFGDGYFSNDPNPVHVFDAPGIFDVSLLVTPLTGGKLTPMTIEDQIKINPRPKASFEYTYQQNALNIPQVKLENNSRNVDRVMWVLENEVISEENTPLHSFTKKGTYNVQLVAINEFGCADTTHKKVVIKEDYNLLAPEAFTPNGDSREDTFIPGALKLIDGSFVMRIVDPRTDMVIFETESYNNPWDGTISGTTVKASGGDYNWIVDVEFKDGKTDQFEGQVKLKK